MDLEQLRQLVLSVAIDRHIPIMPTTAVGRYPLESTSLPMKGRDATTDSASMTKNHCTPSIPRSSLMTGTNEVMAP